MKIPKFFREFSKSHSEEEKDKYKKKMKERGKKYKEEQKDLKLEQRRKEEKLANTEQELTGFQLNLKKTERELQELTKQLDGINKTAISKILGIFKIKALESEIKKGKVNFDTFGFEAESAEMTIDELKRSLDDIQEQLKKSREDVEKETSEMMISFFERERKKWEDAPYTPEEIGKNFSEEHLVSLSLEDYALLLKRFPSEMVTHVTRQGVRDHVGHMWHSLGQDENHNSFIELIKDGRLKSTMSLSMKDDMSHKEFIKAFKLDRFDDAKEAHEYIETETNLNNQGIQSSYSDALSIHFATQEVADSYYGAETGNEIFVAYPSLHIDSQYYYQGNLREGGGGYWNDQWVWANEENGMDINAGIVFISGDAKVDPQTGSQYKISEEGFAKKNVGNMESLKELTESDYIKELFEELNSVEKVRGSRRGMYKNDSDFENARKIISEQMGVTDTTIQNILLDYDSVRSLDYLRSRKEKEDLDQRQTDIELYKILRSNQAIFERPDDTVSSKEYWEKYFDEHPDIKPSKIVYYKGGDPTQGLQQWKRDHGLMKSSESGELKSLGEIDVPKVTKGMERYKSLAHDAIDKYFDSEQQDAA